MTAPDRDATTNFALAPQEPSTHDPTLYWQQVIAIAMELRSREGSRLDAKRDPTGFDYSLTILMR